MTTILLALLVVLLWTALTSVSTGYVVHVHKEKKHHAAIHAAHYEPPPINDSTPHSALWIDSNGDKHVRDGDGWRKL